MSMGSGYGSGSSSRSRAERLGLRLIAGSRRWGGPSTWTRPPRWPWVAIGVDVVLIVTEAGLFDLTASVPLVQGLVSLDGHPFLVRALAAVSLALLIVLVPLTQGFSRSIVITRSLTMTAGMLTLIASAGILAAVLALPVLLVLLILGGKIFR